MPGMDPLQKEQQALGALKAQLLEVIGGEANLALFSRLYQAQKKRPFDLALLAETEQFEEAMAIAQKNKYVILEKQAKLIKRLQDVDAMGLKKAYDSAYYAITQKHFGFNRLFRFYPLLGAKKPDHEFNKAISIAENLIATKKVLDALSKLNLKDGVAVEEFLQLVSKEVNALIATVPTEYWESVVVTLLKDAKNKDLLKQIFDKLQLLTGPMDIIDKQSQGQKSFYEMVSNIFPDAISEDAQSLSGTLGYTLESLSMFIHAQLATTFEKIEEIEHILMRECPLINDMALQARRTLLNPENLHENDRVAELSTLRQDFGSQIIDLVENADSCAEVVEINQQYERAKELVGEFKHLMVDWRRGSSFTSFIDSNGVDTSRTDNDIRWEAKLKLKSLLKDPSQRNKLEQNKDLKVKVEKILTAPRKKVIANEAFVAASVVLLGLPHLFVMAGSVIKTGASYLLGALSRSFSACITKQAQAGAGSVQGSQNNATPLLDVQQNSAANSNTEPVSFASRF